METYVLPSPAAIVTVLATLGICYTTVMLFFFDRIVENNIGTARQALTEVGLAVREIKAELQEIKAELNRVQLLLSGSLSSSSHGSDFQGDSDPDLPDSEESQ